MKLQELTKTIHSNLLTSSILKTNITDKLTIEEKKNKGKTNCLQFLTISNMPTLNCWLFEHEDSEKEFLTSGMKVEKTILFLSEETKELIIILLEMKSYFKIKQLLECRRKLNHSLTHLSIFLATNNHLIDSYRDYKIRFGMAIFCNKELIATNSPSSNEPLYQNFLSFQNGDNKRFNIGINSPSLGSILVPATRVLENEADHITINFEDLLDKLSP